MTKSVSIPATTAMPPVRFALLGRATLLTMLLVTTACRDGAAAGGATARDSLRTPSLEWEREISLRVGTTAPTIAFSAGRGVVAFVLGPPLYTWMMTLADSAGSISGGPQVLRERDPVLNPPVGLPSDIVAVSESSHTWFLDGRTHNVVSEDVGGFTRLITRLHSTGPVSSACALSPTLIAFLDVSKTDTVFVQQVGVDEPPAALPFPDDFRNRRMPWESLRFGGSPAGPCVLHAPSMRGVLIVRRTSLDTVGTFVEPLYPLDQSVLQRAWRAVAGVGTFWRDPPTGAIDATSIAGGPAVLYEGQTQWAGALVDVYSPVGVYVTTLLLPHRALRIAANDYRLLVWSRREGRAYLSSYLLPANLRKRQVERDASVIPPSFDERVRQTTDSLLHTELPQR